MFGRTKTKAWRNLESLQHKYNINMRELFAKDDKRAERCSIQLENMLVDYSKNLINDQILEGLLALAAERGLADRIKEMYSGVKINQTENRAVLHIALRNKENKPIYVDGHDVMPKIATTLEKIKDFSEAVRLGTFTGYTGKKLTNIVNIGIGGSDLGPFMATQALKPYWAKDINCYFISNIDGTSCAEVLNHIDPETTLFIVASKTFTTIETLTNAHTCRKWVVDALGEHAVAKHFVALSTNKAEVEKFGINPDNMFEFWDFVGGRYSMWSAIGLIIAIAVGYKNFERMLEGAYAMDKHFYEADFAHNIPVILALIGIWYINFHDVHRYAVVPYDQYLQYLPSYLQQLDMESNGKSISLDNKFVDYSTAPVVFGGAGTNVQHSFFQLLHQGTDIVPVDFIIPAISHNEIGAHQEILIANVLAQAEALMNGKTEEEAVAEMEKCGNSKAEIARMKKNKSFTGNRPSNMIIVRKLDPYSLGMLVAMYEHRTFVQGVIWNINSFDQFGVELGKKLALNILPELQGTAVQVEHDSSTASLIRYIKGIRK